jgi:outer membrane receptor for ferrienterochelin and colicin
MVGNPALKPENGLFSNLSYAFTGSKLILNVNIFGNYLFNLIGEETGTYTTSTGTIVPAIVYKNIDQAVFYGGELDVKWLIIRNLELESSLSYVQASDAVSGDALSFIPPLHGINSLHYSLKNIGRAALSMNWEYKFSETGSVDNDNHQYMVFDCFLNSRPIAIGKAALIINAGIKNILNTSYSVYLNSLRGLNKLEPGRNYFIKAGISW